jgi:hypothetical protein
MGRVRRCLCRWPCSGLGREGCAPSSSDGGFAFDEAEVHQLFESQVGALFAYMAIEECPDLDPAQAFGGDVEDLADAPGGGIDGGGVEEETGAGAAVRGGADEVAEGSQELEKDGGGIGFRVWSKATDGESGGPCRVVSAAGAERTWVEGRPMARRLRRRRICGGPRAPPVAE